MVRAWYMDDDPSDQRNEHYRNPPEFLDLKKLFEITGVEYFRVSFFLLCNNSLFIKVIKDILRFEIALYL